MTRPLRRARGTLLRLVLQRRLSAAIGIALILPALLISVNDYRWETGVTDGVALILGATGAALIAMAVSGKRADWVDPES